MKATQSLLAVLVLTLASQAFATGFYFPPPQDCGGNCNIELPDCYWTVDFTVAYHFKSSNPYEYYHGSAYFDASKIGGGYDYLKLGDGLYGLDFDFKGKTFTQCDDSDVKLKFDNGNLVGLKFAFSKDSYSYRIDYSDFDKKFNGCWYKKGYVVYGTPSSTCESVPTPAAATSGLALLTAMAFRRRRRLSVN